MLKTGINRVLYELAIQKAFPGSPGRLSIVISDFTQIATIDFLFILSNWIDRALKGKITSSVALLLILIQYWSF